jgi:hypothetical protein
MQLVAIATACLTCDKAKQHVSVGHAACAPPRATHYASWIHRGARSWPDAALVRCSMRRLVCNSCSCAHGNMLRWLHVHTIVFSPQHRQQCDLLLQAPNCYQLREGQGKAAASVCCLWPAMLQQGEKDGQKQAVQAVLEQCLLVGRPTHALP